MKSNIVLLFLLVFIFGCDSPTELPILNDFKLADSFSRKFLDKVIKGELENAYSDVDPEILNDEAKEFITNSSKNLNGVTVKKYSLIEQSLTSAVSSNKGQETFYRLGYEYQVDKGYILFRITVKEKDGKLLIKSFSGEVVQASLSELTKFTFNNKSLLQYTFLFLSLLIPIFVFTTFIIMLGTIIKNNVLNGNNTEVPKTQVADTEKPIE